jgi:predicted nucleotidyltransferase
MRGPDDILPLVSQLKERIEAAYGDRFAGLRLYGSYARGEARDDSDVDLLVLLHGEVDRWKEIDRLVDLAYDLEIESGRLLSLHPRSVKEFEAGDSFFLRHVKRDAVLT